MVGAQDVDGAFGETGLQGLPVALTAQGRHQSAIGIEIADVHVTQVQMVDRHIAGDVQAIMSGAADEVQALSTRDAGDVQFGAREAGELDVSEQGDGFGRGRDARQAEARGHFAVMGHPFARVITSYSIHYTKLYEVTAAGLPAVIAPNMAKQIVGLQAMMAYAAENSPGLFTGYSLTVRESHQAGKADTSGTAKAIVGYFNQMGVIRNNFV